MWVAGTATLQRGQLEHYRNSCANLQLTTQHLGGGSGGIHVACSAQHRPAQMYERRAEGGRNSLRHNVQHVGLRGCGTETEELRITEQPTKTAKPT